MASFLLDSHTLLWWLGEPEKLSAQARERLVSEDSTLYVSAASIWEISIKHRLGKLPLPSDFFEALKSIFEEQGWTALNITLSHARLAGLMKTDHRDPFDRILAAQSQLEKLPLVTNDSAFQKMGVETCW